MGLQDLGLPVLPLQACLLTHRFPFSLFLFSPSEALTWQAYQAQQLSYWDALKLAMQVARLESLLQLISFREHLKSGCSQGNFPISSLLCAKVKGEASK